MSRTELTENGNDIIMGVGNGGGNLFVKGDYDSIKVLQDKLLELEALRHRVKELEKRLGIE